MQPSPARLSKIQKVADGVAEPTGERTERLDPRVTDIERLGAMRGAVDICDTRVGFETKNNTAKLVIVASLHAANDAPAGELTLERHGNGSNTTRAVPAISDRGVADMSANIDPGPVQRIGRLRLRVSEKRSTCKQQTCGRTA